MCQGTEHGPPVICSLREVAQVLMDTRIPMDTRPLCTVPGCATASLLRLFLLLVCSSKAEAPKCPRTSLQRFWHSQAQKVPYVSTNSLLTEDLQPDFQARFQAKLASGPERKAVCGHPHASSCSPRWTTSSFRALRDALDGSQRPVPEPGLTSTP